MYEKNVNNLSDAIKKQKQLRESPLLDKIQSGVYHAITTGHPDPEGRGRLAAYIPKLGGDPDEPLFFQYASPFGGANNQGSYGFFSVPPDAGLTVLVLFADNGELSEGYWFAVVQEVPDVASGGVSGKAQADGTGQGEGAFESVPSAKSNPSNLSEHQGKETATSQSNQNDYLQASGLQSPATDEVDKSLENITKPNTFGELGSEGNNQGAVVDESKENPEDEVTEGTADANATSQSPKEQLGSAPRNNSDIPPNHPRNINTASQGIYSDSIRGQTTSSPVRDASYEVPRHSAVYGWKTPGSNAITMDDGSIGDDGTIHSNQIRIQTGSGASVILDGTNDVIYAINSTGSGWVEIGAAGEVMVYAQGSLSMRAEKDFNLRADQNINMEAGENINLKSGNNYNVNSGNQLHLKSESSQFFDSGGANHTKVSTNMFVSTGGLLHLNGPQAAASPGMPYVTHPDIQNLESTQVEESILSSMPSHEPMMRNKPGAANNSSKSTPSNNSNIPAVKQDPSSVEGQQDARLQTPPPELGNGEGLATVRSRSGASCQVAEIFQRNFQGLIDDLDAIGYEIRMLGGYCERNARGSSRPSFHAMGAAMDINWDTNDFQPSGRRTNKVDLPSNISEIAARHGIGWGGNWSKPWDPMHFSMATAERGAYRIARAYAVASSSSISGTQTVRQA